MRLPAIGIKNGLDWLSKLIVRIQLPLEMMNVSQGEEVKGRNINF